MMPFSSPKPPPLLLCFMERMVGEKRLPRGMEQVARYVSAKGWIIEFYRGPKYLGYISLEMVEGVGIVLCLDRIVAPTLARWDKEKS